MPQDQGSPKGGRGTSEAGQGGGTNPEPSQTKPSEATAGKRSPWWAQVVSNLVAVVVLYLLLFWPFYRASCVPPHMSAASLALIFWSFAQLVWRHIPEAVDAAPTKIFGIGIVLPKVLAALQLRWLWTWVLLLIPVASYVLGLSPISPFRSKEILPIIQGFEIQQSGQNVQQVSLGQPVSIRPDTAHIKVLMSPPNAACEWVEKKGLAQAGCTASYEPPHLTKTAVLSVQITTLCGTQSRATALRLEIEE